MQRWRAWKAQFFPLQLAHLFWHTCEGKWFVTGSSLSLLSKLIGAFFTGRYVPVFSSAERTRRRFLKSKSSGSVPFCFIYCPNCLSLNGVIWNELHNVGDCSSVLFAYSIPRLQNNNTTINGVSWWVVVWRFFVCFDVSSSETKSKTDRAVKTSIICLTSTKSYTGSLFLYKLKVLVLFQNFWNSQNFENPPTL